MSCIDRRIRLGFVGLSLIAGCSSPVPPPPKPTAATNPGPTIPRVSTPAPTASSLRLPPPGPVRNWGEVRLQAAHRLVAANPGGTYTGHVPEPLLAIPVLEIELNGDGSIRRINVLRHPSQANDTTQLAIDAVQRSAPFGDVSRLPKPWRFTETFLFDDDRKFKPRTLDP
ncbi:MAG: hypothetical protein KGL99_14030 [Burkholderiales bacterium]|nr:hypothetical protein [Burkholderiales bacterium]MDE2300403.1 hypothetical protein [Burkholderiales bacterium]MDE2628267.1 hypothetical protein [Burkholderiales bacterium]